MSWLYNFGLCQEDERTEARALCLPGGRLLSVCSAGDMALSLLALGAESIDAVDIEPAQLRLAELKCAAVRALDPEDAVRFLGFMCATGHARRRWSAGVLALLPPASRTFWQSRQGVVEGGAIWAGRFERFTSRIRQLTTPLLRGRFEQLFAATTLDEQRLLFDRHLDTLLLRGVFRVAFAPSSYRGRGIDPRGLRHVARGERLGERWFDRFRAMCTATPARENYFLQLLALGSLLGTDASPAYLSPAGAAVVRARHQALTWHRASLGDWLNRSEPGCYDRFHLSNVCDWMEPSEHDRLLEQIVRHIRGPARVIWRHLHRRPDVPASIAGRLIVDEELATSLAADDRFPVYGIVPARAA